AAFVLIAVITPAVHDYDAKTDANLIARLTPPTAAHPFGTDTLGRDILVRLLHATRVSLGLAVSSVAIAAVVGSTLGFLAGYLRRQVDLVLMFCMDILLAFPATLLAIAIVAMIGPGLRNSLFAISLVSIPVYARLSRSAVLALREQDFVIGARPAGRSPSGTREVHGERRALFRPRLHGDPPALALDERPRDRQAKAEAWHVHRARGFAPIEALEEPRHLLRRDARSGVGDGDDRLLPTRRDDDPHLAAGRRELHGIVEDVGERDLGGARRGVHEELRWTLNRDRHAAP